MAVSKARPHSPCLPTRVELLIFAAYPIILLVGSLFSQLSPSTRAPATGSTYSHAHQSFQPASEAPSYFATKRNVFNVYFVKIGWLWCAVALAAFTLLASRGRAAIDLGLAPLISHTKARPIGSRRLHDMDLQTRRDEQDARLRRRYQVFFRWLLATLAWYITTQSFLGASLVDRLFAWTGGACRAAEKELAKDWIGDSKNLETARALTSKACRKLGGEWLGGYDLSGHVFLLMLGSGVLAFEMLPVIFPWAAGITDARVIRNMSGNVERLNVSQEAPSPDSLIHVTTAADGFLIAAMPPASNNSTSEKVEAKHGKFPYTTSRLKSYGTALALSVVLLSWWMLLMTAAFFHTWAEKSGACILATLVLWAIYVLPRNISTLRALTGMPGV